MPVVLLAMGMPLPQGHGGFYGAQYARIDDPLAREIRREIFDEDIGQEGWRTGAEQAEIADLLRLAPGCRVLDVACGGGGPSLALVERAGCSLVGVDIEASGIAHAERLAAARALSGRATFVVHDCAGRLPFEDAAFDAILCIDAIHHFPGRRATLVEWSRLLRRGGRLVFTDPFVLSGEISRLEIEIRSALGANLSFAPPEFDGEAARDAGLLLVQRQNRTEAVAEIADRWHAARSRRAAQLRRDEGNESFERRQSMLSVAAELARSGRLSRYLYVAAKPA